MPRQCCDFFCAWRASRRTTLLSVMSGDDTAHPKLGRLLYDPVHALAAGYALSERHRQRRLTLRGGVSAHLDPYRVLVHSVNACRVFTARAIKQRDLRTDCKPQHAQHVMGRAARRPGSGCRFAGAPR
jgi:hypothetical protein